MKKRDKIQKRNRIMIGFILIIFLVSSAGSVVLYYGGDSSQNSFTLSASGVDYKFNLKQDNQGKYFYEASSKKDTFSVYSTIDQLNYFDISDETKTMFKSIPFFYFSFDPNDPEITYVEFLRYELRKNLPNPKFYIDSITNTSEVYDLPIVTCENASIQTPVVVFESGNETKLNNNGYCFHMIFPIYDTLRVRDLILYLIRGFEI